MLTYTFKKGSAAAVNIFTEYGVHVDKSSGLVGKPSLKAADSFDWKYLHGSTPDLRNRRYQSKEITLNCWIEADSKQQFMEKFNRFLTFFSYDDLMLMKVTWPTDNNNGGAMPNPHVSRGLFALVWLRNSSVDSFKWHRGKNRCKFTLTFEDPYPVKRIYLYSVNPNAGDPSPSQSVGYDIVSDTEIDIFTEDGNTMYDILSGDGSLPCAVGKYVLVCGDVTRATSGHFSYEAADPEVPVDLTDPTTYIVTGYNLIYPLANDDLITTIYEEI